jgi:hypothetical protein
MTTDPSNGRPPHVCIAAAATKALSALLQNADMPEMQKNAMNGRTTRSVLNPWGCSSKIPGYGNLCNPLVAVSRSSPDRRMSNPSGFGKEATSYSGFAWP